MNMNGTDRNIVKRFFLLKRRMIAPEMNAMTDRGRRALIPLPIPAYDAAVPMIPLIAALSSIPLPKRANRVYSPPAAASRIPTARESLCFLTFISY